MVDDEEDEGDDGWQLGCWGCLGGADEEEMMFPVQGQEDFGQRQNIF